METPERIGDMVVTLADENEIRLECPLCTERRSYSREGWGMDEAIWEFLEKEFAIGHRCQGRKKE